MTESTIQPVYVLVGSDGFLLDAYRREIVETVLAGADPQTSLASYESSAELASVLDALRTLPFLAPRRLVVIRDADAFVTAHREALEEYLQSPVATASLVMMVSSFPKNTRLAKLVAKVGVIYDCKAPEIQKLDNWLVKSAGKRGKKIAPDAAQLLAQWVGGDLAQLDQEIEKLSLYVDPGDTITLDAVGRVVSAGGAAEAFALPNALTVGNAGQALNALGGMLTTRGEEFKTLGMIGWHLRRVVRAQQLVAGGQNPQAAMKAVKVFYNQREFAALLQRRSMTKLADDFAKMLAADRAMKTGTDAKTALQLLVVGLCQ
jgi:DNA polymerase III subunit delta